MNAKTIAIAIALIAGTAVVSSVQASESIQTLATVQVRPAADQLAQQAWEQASGIPTLATVEVRPSADQLAERSGYVAAPVAALFAFVDPGLAEDANCGQLIASAR